MDKNRTKMCWSCEGNIPLNDEICPYCRASTFPITNREHEEEAEDENSNEVTSPSYQTAVTMGLLMGGTFFFLFGSLLLLFSNNGYFTLRWSDSYWYMYFMVSIPMLYFGIQQFNQYDDEPSHPDEEE